jgi:hypothetical protein
VFKGPTLSSYPYTATAKFDLGGYRTAPYSDSWGKPSSCQLQNGAESKSIFAPRGARTRLSSFSSSITRHSSELGQYSRRPFAIYPHSADNTFIYDRSLSSKSNVYPTHDLLAESPFSTSTVLSSPSSSDSTETLHSTPVTENFPAISPQSSRPSRQPSLASHYLSATLLDTLTRAPFLNNSTLPPSAPPHTGSTKEGRGITNDSSFHLQSVTPFRDANRAPAPLSEVQTAPADHQYDFHPSGFYPELEDSRFFPMPSPHGPHDVTDRWTDHLQNQPPGLRATEGSQGVFGAEARQWSDTSEAKKRRAGGQKLTLLIPPRPASTTPTPESKCRNSTTHGRCVRWHDNLICPSPIERRKGWFNRKG